MKTIPLPEESVTAGAELASSRNNRPVRALSGYDNPPVSTKAVKLSPAQLEQEFVITLDTIHFRAEKVTTVLESILHAQTTPPFTLR